jgi:hypothetical protein
MAHWAATGKLPRRVIFMHIPKTAGSSVSLFMKSHFGSSRSRRVVTLDETRGRRVFADEINAARAARYVGGHFGWDTLEEIRGDAFVFTFLRDPVQRLKSAYWHLRGEADVGTEIATRYPTFRAFIESNDSRTRDVMACQLAGSFASETPSLAPEGVAARAISHLATFDYVGFTENFNSDFAHIAAAAGLPAPTIAPRTNVSAERLAGAARENARAPLSEIDRVLAETRVPVDRILFEHARRHVIDGRLACQPQTPEDTP